MPENPLLVDLPLNRTGLSVVRRVLNSPFSEVWNSFDVTTLPRGVEKRRAPSMRVVSRNEVLRNVGRVSTLTGDVIDELLEDVPSLSDPLSWVEIDNSVVTDTRSGERFVALTSSDPNLLAERRAILDVLGRIIGREVDWIANGIEMNVAYIYASVSSAEVAETQRTISQILPIQASFDIADINPAPTDTLRR